MTKEEKKKLFKQAERELILARESDNQSMKMNHRNRTWEILFRILEESDFLHLAICDLDKEYNNTNYSDEEKENRREAVNKHDILQDFIIKDVIPKYCPEKGPLENYVNSVWSKRRNNAHNLNRPPKGIEIVSINDSINSHSLNDADDSFTYEEIIADKVEGVSTDRINEENIIGRYDSVNAIIDVYASLIAYEQSITMKNGKIDGRKQSQLLWNRLLFTEIVTELTKRVLQDVDELDHKTQTFKYVENSFLDHYMSGICRDYYSLKLTSLKTNAYFSIPQKDPEEQLDLPLNTIVWVSYLLASENIKISTENSARATLTEQTDRFYGYLGSKLPSRS